jgi:ribosomal protein S18 acetylase RimI-like enzyme
MPSSTPPHAFWLSLHERLFMAIELPHQTQSGRRIPLQGKLRIQPWHERYQDRAATLIANAYRGHLDSGINDQYQNRRGAQRFLCNIVQYPGCGVFDARSSFLAVDQGGKLAGMCLASIVSNGVGHITQICIEPSYSGFGLGRELLLRSLDVLQEVGCRTATLTVTAANQPATRLYQQLGFTVMHRFPAYVWEGFRG